jgi:hypothetical protein
MCHYSLVPLNMRFLLRVRVRLTPPCLPLWKSLVLSETKLDSTHYWEGLSGGLLRLLTFLTPVQPWHTLHTSVPSRSPFLRSLSIWPTQRGPRNRSQSSLTAPVAHDTRFNTFAVTEIVALVGHATALLNERIKHVAAWPWLYVSKSLATWRG